MQKEIIYIWMKLIKVGSKHKMLEEKQTNRVKLPKHRRKVIIQIRSKINKIKIQRNNRKNQTI